MTEYDALIQTIALTMGVAWASGINLYAAVAMLLRRAPPFAEEVA